MNLIKFPVDATNIFPCANTTKGGQLVTEYNLKSRESVDTHEYVKYKIGPSYVHGLEDFYVSVLNDATGYFPNQNSNGESIITASSSILKINEGRGIIDGHFIETLVPITVDLSLENTKAAMNKMPKLEGTLYIGLRIMYSTEQTIAGSICPENADDFYEGIQLVILPKNEFKLPIDVPDNPEKVTAHLLLATFDYYNERITNIQQNYPLKCQNVDASRIHNIDKLLSCEYLKKSGLNPKKLYIFAGKGEDPITGYDTWCDATDALMVWDNNSDMVTDIEFIKYAEKLGLNIIRGTTDEVFNNLITRYPKATFESLSSGEIALVIPHKQVDYPIHTTHGLKQLYPLMVYKLPVADFISNTPGTVDSQYTKEVKKITSMINHLFHLTSGTQRSYIPILSEDRSELPILNQNWNAGDYVLVGEDNSIEIDGTTLTKAPASLYVVLPGITNSVQYIGKLENLTSDILAENTDNNIGVAINLKGVMLQSITMNSPPDIQNADVYNGYFHLEENEYRGIPNNDYFAIDVFMIDKDGEQVIDPSSKQPLFTRYYYAVKSSGKKQYCDPPVWVTGEISLAETTRIGGFLNVDETALDAGYVYLDDEGHLRLLDYQLLRSGTLAYQLGEDFETSSGLTISEIQEQLDEYINERVAFPNTRQLQKILAAGDDGILNEINIIIHLSAATEEEISSRENTLTIHSIDSRFNTNVNIQILGSADFNTVINIVDCEKVRIETISGTPRINLIRSCLYYDYNILNYLSLGTIEDMRLWYTKRKITDPDLVVDYMTVREFNTPTKTSSLDFYDNTEPNDNHFLYGLQSLTFSGDGTIIGCSLLVRNDSTDNVQEGKFIIGKEYTIPQGGALMYPTRLLRKQIKVTGQFISAYHITSPDKWMIQNTSFTALSQAVTVNTDGTMETISGTITFLVDAFYVDNTQIKIGTGAESIDGWEPSKFHVFYGGVLS